MGGRGDDHRPHIPCAIRCVSQGRRHHRKWVVHFPPTFKSWGVQVGYTGGTDYCFLSRSFSMFEHSYTSHDHNRIQCILNAQLQPQYSLTEGFYCAMLMQSAVFAIVFCPSVCLSHACIVPELRSRSP